MFIANDPSDFTYMLERLAPAQRQYLRHIALFYNHPDQWRSLKPGFDIVRSLAQLRRFTMTIREGMFTRGQEDDLRDPRDDIHEYNVPGLHVLRSMRQHTDIVIESDRRAGSPVAAYFKAETAVQAAADDVETTVVEEESPVISNLGSKRNPATVHGAALLSGILRGENNNDTTS